MKKNFFLLLVIGMFLFVAAGCGKNDDEDESYENTSGTMTITSSYNEAIGNIITLNVDFQDVDVPASSENFSLTMEILNQPEGSNIKFEEDSSTARCSQPLYSFTISGKRSLSFRAKKVGWYKFKATFNDGKGGLTIAEYELYVQPLVITPSFIDGSYNSDAKLLITSNGDRMIYSVWFGEGTPALIQYREPAAEIVLDTEPKTSYSYKVIGYNYYEEFGEVFAGEVSNEVVTGAYEPPNRAPIVDLDPNIAVYVGVNKILNKGNTYDPDGDSLTYLWSIIEKPAQSQASLIDANTSTPTFKADISGTYKVKMEASDGELKGSDTMMIYASLPPVPVVEWTRIGLAGQTIRDLDVHPTDPNIIYAMPQGYGIYLSSDRGKTWRQAPSSDHDMDDKNIYELYIYPEDPNIIYVATWGVGVWRSKDGGLNWSHSGLDYSYIGSIVIESPDTVYAAGTDGIYEMSGDVWTKIYEGTVSYFNSIAGDPNIGYVATTTGVLKFTNAGVSYQNNGLSATDVRVITSYGSKLYCGVENGGIFVSNNGAVNWTAINNGFEHKYPKCILPVSDTLIFCGTWQGGVYYTEDGGQNWKPLGALAGTASEVWDMVRTDNRLIIGTSDGLYQCAL